MTLCKEYPHDPYQWKHYFAVYEIKLVCGGMPGKTSAIKIVGVTVNANSAAATHNKRLFFTVYSPLNWNCIVIICQTGLVRTFVANCFNILEA